MKKCSCCGVVKERSEFGVDREKRDGLKHQCRICDGQRRRRGRDAMINFSLEYKGGECCDCGKSLSFNENKGHYNFHHVDPSTKVSRINQMFKDKVSYTRLLEELDKCVLLCKPCHIKRHKDFNNGLRETL
jgi:5-methylcytosine-specific restriction endonuclease McrA